MSVFLLLFGVFSLYGLAYLFYSKLIEQRLFKIDDSLQTPAHTFKDGIDYLPTPKHILFGHHFASIAGAAPIIGPCIAVYWGWLPALAWVILGNIFMGAVHDMGSLFLSVRHKAQSIASISGIVFNKKIKLVFLVIILFLIWIIAAAFAVVIAKLFVAYPSSVLPTNLGLVLAMIIGYLLYVHKVPALIPSIVALILLYAFIPLGIAFPIDLSQIFGISEASAMATWVIYLMLYGFAASVLPVWLLLQPRDYINSHQLILGLGILVLGIAVTKPEIVAPAINTNTGDAPNWFPYLFTVIACGAVSGAHGLIASGTTSKQIARESDIRPIAYGSMLLEGILGILAIIAATAGFKNVEAWQSHYHTWTHASKHGLDAFVEGSANFLANLSIPSEYGAVFISIIVISFASTTLDTIFRIQRFIIAEFGTELKIKILENRYLGSVIAVASALALTFSGGSQNLTGAFTLWPLFGTSNQILAALTMILIAKFIYIKARESGSKSKLFLLVLIPALLLNAITLNSNFLGIQNFLAKDNDLLAGISILLMLAQVYILVTGLWFRRK